MTKWLDLIVKNLDDGKAKDILTLNLTGRTSLADYLVIASGTSARHINALALHLAEVLKKEGRPVQIEGKNGTSEWMILDLGDIIVHLFHPVTRAFYEIEEMWGVKTPKTEEV